jgi:hypothetical protein
MAFISRSAANELRDNYRNGTFTNQKNIEAALFSIEEVKLLLEALPQEATHLKVFLVMNDHGFIDMCMTGSKDVSSTVQEMSNGKPEIDTILGGLLHSDLPCPPHCGQGDNGTTNDGLDHKYVFNVTP